MYTIMIDKTNKELAKWTWIFNQINKFKIN